MLVIYEMKQIRQKVLFIDCAYMQEKIHNWWEQYKDKNMPFNMYRNIFLSFNGRKYERGTSAVF